MSAGVGGGEPAATATVAVRVAADPAAAFRAFTVDIDRWWRRGRKFRHGVGEDSWLGIEPRLDGRVLERWRDDGGVREFELGRVTVWAPPARLVFTWRNATFADVEQTEIDVTFAPVSTGTLVTVRHRGWERLREDHPARHGESEVAFARTLGLWWGELLTQLRRHLRSSDPPDERRS